MLVSIAQILFSVLIAQSAGFLGSIFTMSSIPIWYVFLEKPFFAPPNWLFAPAWILLYTLMAIAAFLIWRAKHPNRKYALQVYFLNLILNAWWSVIFFGLLSPGLAFFEILILWTVILMTMVQFYKIKKEAGFILLPYLLWVSFAANLNFGIWLLN